MAKWSNSRNGNLRYSVNRENASGIYIGPTQGLSSPKNSRRACLCLHSNTYDVRCCNGASARTLGGFSDGYSDGFDV
jgi:hypothetical protein